MSIDLNDPPDGFITFLTERHLATLTITGPDDGTHVTPVGVTYEPARRLARIITWSASVKARAVNARPGQRVAVCQVDGGRWLTLYGTATVTDEADAVAEAVTRYAARYRQPKERDDRVVIEIDVDRVMGRW
ncbi:MAG: pyridoxamine 5'-phosphate oxidase family protein [Actinomycetota bacterium]